MTLMNASVRTRPRGWLKFFFKIPVLLARLGLAGWESMLGLEWMLLTTRGRKSGKKRYAMVDVLFYERETDTYFIEAGFGETSDWYRNLQTTPVFEAQVKRCKFQARAETILDDQKVDIIINFVRQRPLYAKAVMKSIGVSFASEEELRQMALDWSLLAIHPLKNDLAGGKF